MQEQAEQVYENQVFQRSGLGLRNRREDLHEPVPAQPGHLPERGSVRPFGQLHGAERIVAMP